MNVSKWQSGSSHYEELLCQWACSQTADLSAGTVIAATTQQDCRRSVTAVKARAMDGRAKASRDQEMSWAVRRGVVTLVWLVHGQRGRRQRRHGICLRFLGPIRGLVRMFHRASLTLTAS